MRNIYKMLLVALLLISISGLVMGQGTTPENKSKNVNENSSVTTEKLLRGVPHSNGKGTAPLSETYFEDMRKAKALNRSVIEKMGYPERFPHGISNKSSDVPACLGPNESCNYGALINDIAPKKPYILGLYAQQDVKTSLLLGSGNFVNTLYAPTLMFPNGGSLEATTSYTKKYSDSDYVERKFAVWDHSRIDLGECGMWVVEKQFDSDFLNKYTTTLNGGERIYQVEIWDAGKYFGGSSIWAVYLYNYNTQLWDVMYSTSVKHENISSGWDIWESYFPTVYPTSLPTIHSRNVCVIQVGGCARIPTHTGNVNR